MRSFIFSCHNPNCELTQNKMRTFKTSTGTISRFGADNETRIDFEDEDDVEAKQPCTGCDQPMRKERQIGCAIFIGSSLMSPDQKRDMLLRRSRVHSNKPEQRDHRSEMLNRQNREFGLPSKNK